MKRLSEKELNQKIEQFLNRKNAEVFHSQNRELVVDLDRINNFALVKFA